MTHISDENAEPRDAEIVETQPKPAIEKIVPIVVDAQTGAMVARDNSELFRIIKTMMKGQAFPKSLDTEEKILSAWQVAASLKLPPAAAIKNIAIIHGSIFIWGELPKALAEATGEMQDFKLLLIDDKHKVISLENSNLDSETWGAVVQIRRKGRSINEYTFTMVDAKKAGLAGKSGPWKDYTKIMLSRRAIAHAIKFEFPDALMGVGIAEQEIDFAPDLQDVTPKTKKESSLNAKIAKASQL